MVMNKCPYCSKWYSVPVYASDYLHKCYKSDGTAKVEDRVMVNYTGTAWNLQGMQGDNVHFKKSKESKRDSVYRDWDNVEYISFD